MKKLFYIILSLCILAGGCQKYDDTELRSDIDDLKDRVETLESLCQNMNKDIVALKALVEALQNHDYIVSVTPIYEGGNEIGYKILFGSGTSITIYHGEDGADGTNGQDGATPVIGVRQGEDGVYYWTLNDEWLLDDKGQKVKAVGEDGKDSKDGVTPQLKIEDDMWYVSYDNGGSWHEVGPATGEQGPQGETGPQGPQGDTGLAGDSMFTDVDYSSSSDYVIFTLSNGTQIKVPTWSAFEALQLECEKMNTNIMSLQAIVEALQANDYIVSVSPIYEGVTEIGYKILFGSGNNITIYHGENASTPVIGVRQDTDGIYYWTIDGEWLLDDKGQKVKTVGDDGRPGQDGDDGQDGKDGITPQLKIEGGMWYVSYDNGVSWHEVGPATGEQGPQGPQGSQGDSLFKSVTQDDSNVYFTLADGTKIIIPKESLCPVKMTLGPVTSTTATLNGTVDMKSMDLKVTIHYSTSADLTVYDSESVSQTKFSGNTFNIVLNNLIWNTQYYYFVAVIYNGKTYYSEVNSFMTADDTISLSSTGTANSYIVSGRGMYSFPAVKGNSSESVGSVSSVEVLWESFGTDVTPKVGDLVKNVSYKNGEITFQTADTFKEGNAVIAAKNASGTILWSWHIWLTDQPEGQVYYDNAGTMMDRNLGATSATPRDVGALGLLYQWGRKDPFLGYSSIYEEDYDYEIAKSTITWPSSVKSNASNGTIEYAIAHPTTFIERDPETYDWYYTDSSLLIENTRWTTSDKPKSIYDPCPAGWRIPDGDDDNGNSVWARASGDTYFEYNYKKEIEGMNFSGWFGSASTIWYPFTLGDYGLYWSASPRSNLAYALYIRVDSYGVGEVYSDEEYRVNRYSVRCIQE